MSTYLIINIFIIIIPLLFSNDRNLRFYKNLKYYFNSVLVISSIYIIWDVIATARGDWSFSPGHTSGLNIFNLPFEEVLFFITVPYSCIFIYETVSFYTKEKKIEFTPLLTIVSSLVLIVTAIIFNEQAYTFTVLLITAAFFPAAKYLFPAILNSKHYWLTMLITFIPFFGVNYILTSLPVVSYNDDAIWTVRVTTIPLEDFFYSFSMISYWLLFYKYFKQEG